MRFIAHPAAGPLSGRVRVPGDKSLSHRAVLFAAMAEGTSRLDGVLDSADVQATISAVSALGADVREIGTGIGGRRLDVRGWGTMGPREPAEPVDCGNSGTTARMLLGVVASWPVSVTLVGDESLSRRPMLRVTEPLEQMGATFETTDGHLPVTVRGAQLRAIVYESPVASAQVKSAVLLAGLRADGRTTVREPSPSRDHTERLLPAFGVPVGREPATCSAWVDGPAMLHSHDFAVPADPSSAAFLAAAALLVPDSEIVLADVALNRTRTGFLRVLGRMRADLHTSGAGRESDGRFGDEPVGDITARGTARLRGTVITADEVPSLVDEVPILALVATQAVGTTRFEGIGELRVKESDRLAAMVDGLNTLGASAEAGEDWLEVTGPTPLRGATLDSLGDHRLAMTWAIAGLIAQASVTVDRFEAVSVSYPSFSEDLTLLTGVTSGDTTDDATDVATEDPSGGTSVI